MSETTEVWRDIEGWPYQVSSLGNVRTARAVKPKKNEDGYVRVGLYDGDRCKHFSVHRLVAMAFLGNPPFENAVVAHRNGNPKDNRPENLYWATVEENAADRRLHGNYPQGEGAPNSKLTNAAAARIRQRFNDRSASISALAREHGVSRQTIRRVAEGRGYKNAEGAST